MSIENKDLRQLFATMLTLRRVWMIVLIVGVYSLIPLLKEHSPFASFLDLPSSIFGIFGAVLSVILVFRTNRAYDRWWEARTLWGKQVNISRNLSIKILKLAHLDEAECRELHRLIAGFSYALKDHLRTGANLAEIPGWQTAEQTPVHVPNWIAREIYSLLDRLCESGRLTGDELRVCDTDAHEFLNVCGGCERIRNTPIAKSYRSYAIKCLFLYLATLPWGLVQDLGWLTTPVSMIVCYVMVGLETIADDVEEPFGDDLDDLDLDGLCGVIDRTTAEILSTSILNS